MSNFWRGITKKETDALIEHYSRCAKEDEAKSSKPDEYTRGYIDALKQVIENAEALIECAEYDPPS